MIRREATPACADCHEPNHQPGRRDFLARVGGMALAAGGGLLVPKPVLAQPTPSSPAETAVKALYETLTPEQRKEICFGWDHIDPKRGLLRTHVSNNWQITQPKILGSYFSKKQQDLIHDIFKGIINPQWYDKFLKQLKEDTGGKPWEATRASPFLANQGTANLSLS